MPIIDLTPGNIADYGVCGYKDVEKHLELRKKIEWYKEYYPKGLRIKIIFSKNGGYQGMLEYIPGKYAHRPVDADGYMFIHCIFVGFKKVFKGKGYASLLIDECFKEAEDNKMLGVAVVTRKGPFMAHNALFLKKGFEVVDDAEPDFELLVKKFDDKSKNPKFKSNMNESLKKYDKGLTILRSAQCPYSEKNVNAIMESAKKLNLKINLIDLKDVNAVQNTPCAFGSFCLIYNGEIISYHPISNTRFVNIMKKKVK
ncbi:MAG: YoaP domain-containing protein [Promethearchaeota archaeon]